MAQFDFAFALIIQSQRQLWRNRIELLQLSLFPIGLIVLLNMVDTYFQANNRAFFYLMSLGYLFAYAYLLVPIYQFLLENTAYSKIGKGSRLPTKIECFFALYLLCLNIVFTLLASLTLNAGWFLSLCIKALVLAKISLVFPGISIGQRWSFFRSWRATKGYFSVMFIIACVILAFRYALLASSAYIVKAFGVTGLSLIVNTFIELVAWVMISALLAITFKVIYLKLP